jgi:hypothetical protein
VSEQKIFHTQERTRLGPAQFAEPSYKYLDMSARPECQRVRELLEEWFAPYPQERKAELLSLLQGTNEDNFVGAFFELYCAALLTRQAFAIKPHPSLANGKETHLDFEVSHEGKPVFYLESRVVQSRDLETERRLNLLDDTFNLIPVSRFSLGLRVIGEIPKALPSVSQILSELDPWLGPLSVDEVTEQIKKRGYKGIPSRTITVGDWHIECLAWPISSSTGMSADLRLVGSSSRPLGISRRGQRNPMDTFRNNMQEPLLAKLGKKKSGQYGDLS